MGYNQIWFIENVGNGWNGYEILYRSFEEGDFGSLDEIEFENERFQGSIDFWGMGHVGIFLFDVLMQQELLNLLLFPDQILEKEDAISKFIKILKQ